MTKFKPGDVGFLIHHDNWISRTMAWFMRSRWSHAFLVLEQTADRTYVLETSDFEVCISTLDRYLDDPAVTLEIWRGKDIDPGVRKNICQAAMRLLGEIYGYLQLLSLGLRCLLKRIGVTIPNFIRQGSVCNQVPMTGYVEGSSISEFKSVDVEGLDTEEAYRIFVNSPEFELVYTKLANVEMAGR